MYYRPGFHCCFETKLSNEANFMNNEADDVTNLMWLLYFITKLIYPSKKRCTLSRTLLSSG